MADKTAISPGKDAAGARKASIAARSTGVVLALGAIRLYQLTFSAILGRQCRYMPSCSSYMAEAIARHGLWIGGWIGLARLARCHPFGAHGPDLVPDHLPGHAVWYAPWRYGRWRICHQGGCLEDGTELEDIGQAGAPAGDQDINQGDGQGMMKAGNGASPARYSDLCTMRRTGASRRSSSAGSSIV